MQTKPSFFLILFLFLTACGYQLRGAVELPEGMENLYLENASGPLRDEVRKALKFSKGQLVPSPKEAGVLIKILREEMRTRVLSVSSLGKANQFELIYSLIFSIHDSTGAVLLANQRVQSQRSYFNDQVDVLAQTNEEQLIRNEMYSQASRSILIRARIAMENSQKIISKKSKLNELKKKGTD
ncbi:MAG: hypothetical protein Q9M50_12500 [Methylococcales bacterium]|nr:hypothetical protein [Methylococcales bacterium]